MFRTSKTTPTTHMWNPHVILRANNNTRSTCSLNMLAQSQQQDSLNLLAQHARSTYSLNTILAQILAPQLAQHELAPSEASTPSRSRSRFPINELHPAQIQEENLLVTPEDIIQQHEWQYRFEQDQIRPEWHIITSDRYRASYIALFTRIIGIITQTYPAELPPMAVLHENVRTAFC